MRTTRCLQISIFVVCCLDSVIPIPAKSKISRLQLFPVAEQAGFSDLVENPKVKFSHDGAHHWKGSWSDDCAGNLSVPGHPPTLGYGRAIVYCAFSHIFPWTWQHFFYLGFMARQDYFTHFEPSIAKWEEYRRSPRKTPDHPQQNLACLKCDPS